jgi:hypothetical protein
MNAPTFPLNPTVGQFWQNWVWNGVRWVCTPASGVRVIQQVFNASGPYMPSPGLVTAVVECVAGGGGGGGAMGTYDGAAGFIVSAGGGASGGYSRSALAAALVLGGVQITIGQGGAGAPAPTATGSNNIPLGSQGGDTTFGALVIAHGGFGGGSANPAGGSPGPAAQRGVGDLTVVGNAGHSGASLLQDSATGGNISGGTGGASFFGGAGLGGWVATTAAPGGNGTDGGGGGGAGSGTLQPEPGGNGGNGVCVVTEYCWADSGTGDCDIPVNVAARVEIGRDGRWGGPHVEPFGSFEDGV